MPLNLERLARSAVYNPITIRIGMGSQKTGKMADTIKQNIIYTDNSDRKKNLLNTLRKIKKPPVLIFVNSVAAVENIVYQLRSEQFHVAGIHSEMDQQIRFLIMEAFKQGINNYIYLESVDILVSTDLASRGIDFSDVTHVIIYEMPDNIEDYIHRCGRTGRAGRRGQVTAFLTNSCKIVNELRLYLKENGQVYIYIYRQFLKK